MFRGASRYLLDGICNGLHPINRTANCRMAATQASKPGESWFGQARFIPPDAIFALTAQYNSDPFPKKVNLGQGTYRDENGKPWVLPSVQKSRQMLLSQGLNHEYLPILGLADFRDSAAELALGPELFAAKRERVWNHDIHVLQY